MSKKMIVFALALISFGFCLSVSAAVDADLTATYASGTAFMTDNKSAIMTFIAGLAGAALVIGLGKLALIMAVKWIKKAFSGGNKRR